MTYKKIKLTDAEYNARPTTTAMLYGKRLDVKIKRKFARKAKQLPAGHRPAAMVDYKYRFIVDGHNMKLGEQVASWSTLYGSREFIVLEMDGMAIRGTCHNCEACEDSCYVAHSYRNSSPIFSHARNTWGLRHEPQKVFADLDKQLNTMEQPYIRINQSGDMESEEELYGWIMLAENHPEKIFYLYTKRYDIATPVLLGGGVPENLVILYSIWHEVGVAEYEMVKHLPNVKSFIYNDGTDLMVTPTTRCYAYKGRVLNHEITCGGCKRCIDITNPKYKDIVCDGH